MNFDNFLRLISSFSPGAGGAAPGPAPGPAPAPPDTPPDGGE